jgi:hypothetical protein
MPPQHETIHGAEVCPPFIGQATNNRWLEGWRLSFSETRPRRPVANHKRRNKMRKFKKGDVVTLRKGIKTFQGLKHGDELMVEGPGGEDESITCLSCSGNNVRVMGYELQKKRKTILKEYFSLETH